MTHRAILLTRTPYLQVGRVLREDHGWETFGYDNTALREETRRGLSGHLDLHRVVQQAAASPPGSDILARAARLEARDGGNLADVLIADRHLGSGWVTGGLYHGGALSRLPYEGQLQVLCDLDDAIEAYLAEIRPTLVMAGQVGCAEIATMYAACARRDIPCFGLTFLNYGSNYYWQAERAGHVPGLEETYRVLRGSGAAPPDVAMAPVAPRTRLVMPQLRARGQVLPLVGRVVRSARHHARGALRGQVNAGGVTFWSKLDYHLQNFRGFRREMRRPYTGLAQLEGRRFVYYPLHFEPEATLSGVETLFTNQLYAVEVLSKSVPSDVAVMVKEHPAAIGNRPPGWMDILARFPRVVLAHPFDDSIALVRHSGVTVTIAGTAGLEAALLGKPVLSLGPSYRLNFVDHVSVANDIPTLRRLLRDLLDRPEDPGRARDAAILRQAIERCCFQLDDATAFRDTTEADARTAARELLRMLRSEGARPAGMPVLERAP